MTDNIQTYSPFDVDIDNQNFDWAAFKTEYDKKTPPIKALIFNLETAVFLKDQIAVKFNLNENQVKELARIVRDILITKIYLGKIVEETKTKLIIDENTAKEIAHQIINNLFAPALQDIKKLHTEKFGESKLVVPQEKPSSFAKAPADKDEKINLNNVLDLRNKS